jgi:hypothetical protein
VGASDAEADDAPETIGSWGATSRGASAAAAGAAGTGAAGVGAGVCVEDAGLGVAATTSLFVAVTSSAATGLAAAALVAAAFFFAAGFGAAGAAAGIASFNRRATGASTVDEAERTNSPSSCNLARTTLLSTPSSLASS